MGIRPGRSLEHVLAEIVAGTAGATGDVFFNELVRHLASAVECRNAFVGEIVGSRRSRVQTIAVWTGDRLGADAQYDLRGTPCEDIAGQTTRHYPRDVQSLFPADALLEELGVESYLGTPLFSSAGEALGVLAVMDDGPMDDPGNALEILRIFAGRAGAELERQRAGEALQESERSLRALLNATDDTALLIDTAGGILAANKATERRLRQLASGRGHGLLGRSVYDFFPDDLARTRRERNEEVISTGDPARFEDERGDRWSDNSLYPVFDKRGNVVRLAVFSRDVTERKLAERELAATLDDLASSREALAQKSALLEQTLATEREHARRDPLTQALNHGAITLAMHELAERRAEPAAFAVLIADVNGMKVINDTYGHLVGDGVLITVSNALQCDGAIVGRYGGDEFVVVLEGADRAAAEGYRDAVREHLTRKRVTDPETGATVQVAVSIGIAMFPEQAQNVSDLLKRSDEEMYAAKRQRPLMPGGFAAARLVTDDRIASTVGDLVPLVVSRATLSDKLRAIAHRLAMRDGYAAVNFDIFDGRPRTIVAQNAFVKASDELLDAWRREQAQVRNHPIGAILDETHAPFVMHDAWHDEHLTKVQRELLGAAGIHSGICVPMMVDDRVIGVMSVGSRDLAAFGESDVNLLSGVAAQLAPLIDMLCRIEGLGRSRAA